LTMQFFRVALGAALVSAALAAPAREARANNVPITTLARNKEPCAILIPGYDAPICDNALTKPGTFGTTAVTKLPFDVYSSSTENLQQFEIRQNAKQNGAGGLSKFPQCKGFHEDGKPMPTLAEWQTHGTDEKFSDQLTCSIITGHHRSYISGPHSCAELCDLDESCMGFQTKTPHCTLFNIPESEFRAGRGSSTTLAANFLANPDANPQVTSGNEAGKGTLGPRIYFKSSANSQDICQATSQIEKPCVPYDGYKWGTATAIDVTAMNSALTWGTDNTAWLGTAPAEFKAANVAAKTISAKYEPNAVYSAADPDCGCEYGKWTTGIKAGSLTGYGFYEAKLTSTALNYANVFWMQGETTEMNILKVNDDGKAKVSYHCFDDEGSTETEESAEFDVDLSGIVTAGFLFTEDKIEVIINNVVKYSKATPTCMQGATMKPIFSIEAADTLPEESSASDGVMTITYLRKWAPTVPTGNGDYLCASVYDSGAKSCNDQTSRAGTAGSHCKHLGPYEGLGAGMNFEKGLCGLSVLRKKQHRLQPPLEYAETGMRVRGDPSVGGKACDETPSCVAVHYYPERTVDGVYEAGFSMLMGSGTTRTDEGTHGILFLRKEAVDDACVDDDVTDDYRKVCNEKVKSNSKYYRCPVPKNDGTTNTYFRNMPDAFGLDDGGRPNVKTNYANAQGGNPVYLSSVTLAECKQMTNDASAHMRTAYAAQRSESEDDIPVSWLCNSFGWKATPWVGEDVGQCSPMMFSTTSSESSGQFDYAWDTWITTLHNIKI